MRSASSGDGARIMRAISSTSNTHRERNGVASAAARAGVVRIAFSPHCVSYTGSPSTSEATVAKIRPW